MGNNERRGHMASHMEGFVLAENTRMLALARRLGFTVQTDPGDATVMIVRRDLTAPVQTDRP